MLLTVRREALFYLVRHSGQHRYTSQTVATATWTGM